MDFDLLESTTAHIYDYERRFWQGSHDHRGTPANPGRVLTLIQVPGARCFGRAFKVEHNVFEHIDHREKNGYLREEIDISLADGRVVRGLVYMATPDNAAYLGEATINDIAEHIWRSEGLSGKNRDYVFELAKALKQNAEHDEHVFAIENLLLKMT